MNALHAEWTKLRTVPSTAWLLLTTVALTVGISSLATSVVKCPASCSTDTTKLSLTGIMLGQAAVAALAVLVMSGEYSTGMIRVSLAAVPRRGTVLAAKAAVVTGVVVVTGAVSVLGSVLIARVVLPGNGFAAISLMHGPTFRAAAGSVLYMALIALLGLGAASACRDSAVAVTAVLGVLYFFPIIGVLIPNPLWQHRIERWTPMDAGLAIQATKGLKSLPIGPWPGLGVLAIWAAVALLAGALLFRLRDA
jgi:ABC-2 type transport system permease protein